MDKIEEQDPLFKFFEKLLESKEEKDIFFEIYQKQSNEEIVKKLIDFKKKKDK